MTPPTIVVDVQEKRPLVFAHLPTEVRHLETGDYTVAGCEAEFCIERKSIPDLIGCLTAARGRFSRELRRMEAFPFRRLVVIGDERDIELGRYRSRATPQSITASLASIEVPRVDADGTERRGVPIRFFASPQQAALTIERWAWYYVREKAKQKHRKEAANAETV